MKTTENVMMNGFSLFFSVLFWVLKKYALTLQIRKAFF